MFGCEEQEKDCAGVAGGTSYEDECGGCDANVNNDCVQDCADVWGGNNICGCTDSTATNYNSIATYDDGSCEDCTGVSGGDNICGCTDSTATNYNSIATYDDGSCEDCAGVSGGDNICGCTDSTATNYDSTATYNDESCEYDTTPPTVTITFPESSVSEAVSITCISTDNEGVEKVELWVNDVSTGVTDNTEPYSLDWNTTTYDDGSYVITVRSYDTSGNTTISDPITLFVSNWLLQLNMAWSNFVDGGYDIALGYFNLAKNNVQYNNMDTLSLHSAYGDIYTGIGWCNLRLLHAETARDNFIISQGYELHSFGTSVGLMAAYLELGNGIPIDTTQINLAIEIGHWILSSSMPEEFENDTTINVNDVKFLMGKSYYSKGNYSNNTAEEAGALYWILQLDSFYAYLDENSPLTWNFYNNGEQDYDSFEEVILMIILLLESEYW